MNGVPVNDSGNFAVYPQEYADQEKPLHAERDAGQPGCGVAARRRHGRQRDGQQLRPRERARRFRVSQTLGGLSLTRSFIRFDTGRLPTTS